MKKLLIKNTTFQYLEHSFKEWLDILGYAPSTVYDTPNKIRELFYHLETEEHITHIGQLEIKHIKNHYQELKTRPNTRQGGGLSNAYLNKHIQALYKFTEYLRQSGKITLPHLSIKQEDNDTKEIEYLTQSEIKELYRMTENYNAGTFLEPYNARDRANALYPLTSRTANTYKNTFTMHAHSW